MIFSSNTKEDRCYHERRKRAQCQVVFRFSFRFISLHIFFGSVLSSNAAAAVQCSCHMAANYRQTIDLSTFQRFLKFFVFGAKSNS